jgi:hypothetical protein
LAARAPGVPPVEQQVEHQRDAGQRRQQFDVSLPRARVVTPRHRRFAHLIHSTLPSRVGILPLSLEREKWFS